MASGRCEWQKALQYATDRSRHARPRYVPSPVEVRASAAAARRNGTALESHAFAAHRGKVDPDCAACRELSAEVVH